MSVPEKQGSFESHIGINAQKYLVAVYIGLLQLVKRGLANTSLNKKKKKTQHPPKKNPKKPQPTKQWCDPSQIFKGDTPLH